MCLLLSPNLHHGFLKLLLISRKLYSLLLLVLAVHLVPFERILRRVVLVSPFWDVAGYEGTPELGILALQLGRVDFDLV